MKKLIGSASLALAFLSSTGYGNVHCDCSGSCGGSFSATAWSEYPSELDARDRCHLELRNVCLSYGYPGILEQTVKMNCREHGIPLPNPVNPPTQPTETIRCQVDLMGPVGNRASFYGDATTQFEALDIANRQCYSAVANPQEYCKTVGCIM